MLRDSESFASKQGRKAVVPVIGRKDAPHPSWMQSLTERADYAAHGLLGSCFPAIQNK
jgi:hypothetical protein